MTKIVFYKHRGAFYGFRETGHAGFAAAGDDILCSAISAMTMLVINTLEVAYAADVDYQIDERTTNITVTCKAALGTNDNEKQQYAAHGLLYGYYLQLNDMLEDYYDYLDVDVEERAV
ncbi:MAG: ribosomal-processing cysteine protease Prp [Clostridia bacterium]|jgi:uncharacterized protein YsxB (DUF464 family)|nr:ribosomal-processing cysteine protease Prp [Clostridia bacterium]